MLINNCQYFTCRKQRNKVSHLHTLIYIFGNFIKLFSAVSSLFNLKIAESSFLIDCRDLYFRNHNFFYLANILFLGYLTTRHIYPFSSYFFYFKTKVLNLSNSIDFFIVVFGWGSKSFKECIFFLTFWSDFPSALIKFSTPKIFSR